MTNPRIYVPAAVALRSVHAEPGLQNGYAVLEDDLSYVMGFHLRHMAKLRLVELDARSGVSSTEIAIELTKAQAFTDLADEIDPDHSADTVALWDARRAH